MNGSIRKRGQNSWELTIHLGKDEHGKRKRQFVNVKGRKAYADKRLRELLAAAEKGLPIDTSKLSVGDYLDRWHRDYVHPNTRPRTVDRYLGDITNHLKPLLGHLPLSKVSPADVQRMEATLIAKGLSPRSVEHAHRVLSQSFKHATGWGLTWRNPCDSVRPPRKVQKELSIPDIPTVLDLLELTKQTPHHTGFHFLAYTGARRGEACGLMWRDVDLERGMVSITQAATKTRTQGVIMAPPKTNKGRRAITLDTDTVELLRSHRGQQMVSLMELGELYENHGYVFAGPLGAPVDPDALTYAWKQVVRKAGVGTVRLHDLRHFHATVLMKEGIHPKVVQERLGHSVISVTMDTYSHVVPGLQEKAATAFSQAMKG